MGYNVKDFDKEVIKRSYEIPVLVDFWAEWCAPCRVLGPILERLAQRSNGKWQLAKLNTEEFPNLAQEYGIYSIPNVKLFVDGDVAGEFVGALPEYQVQQWLDRTIPSRYSKQIDRAEALMGVTGNAEARQLLEEVLDHEPDNVRAKVILARAILFKDPAEAARLLENLEDPEHSELIEAVGTIARLHKIALDPGSLPDATVRDTYQSAVRSLFEHDFDTALQKFIEVIRTDRYYDDDGPRKACIAIFKILGEDHEITLKHRRDFGSALYV